MIRGIEDFDNTQIERRVRLTMSAFGTVAGSVGITAGALLWESLRPAAQVSWTLYLALLLGASLGTWLFGYFMMGSGMIRLTVPTRISLSGESIIGDFRRPKWTGSEFREIRYEDIRSIGRTRVFRIPVVRGNPDYRRNKPIKDTSLLYLSSDNIERVNAVIRQRRTPNP